MAESCAQRWWDVIAESGGRRWWGVISASCGRRSWQAESARPRTKEWQRDWCGEIPGVNQSGRRVGRTVPRGPLAAGHGVRLEVELTFFPCLFFPRPLLFLGEVAGPFDTGAYDGAGPRGGPVCPR